MARKVKQNNYKAGIVVIVAVLAIIGISAVVRADNVQTSASDLIEIIKAGSGNEKVILAAFDVLRQSGIALGAAPSDIASGFYDVYVENDLTVDGDFISNGTSTPSKSTLFPVVDTLDLTGTSTAKGATQNVISYYTNTGSQKMITRLAVGITTQLNAFEASIQCGKTTWVGGVEGVSLTATTSEFMIASTTIASTYDVNDSGVLDILNTTTPVMLDNNEVLFCTWTPYGATSSDSFTSAGGFTGAGKMVAEIYAW